MIVHYIYLYVLKAVNNQVYMPDTDECVARLFNAADLPSAVNSSG